MRFTLRRTKAVALCALVAATITPALAQAQSAECTIQTTEESRQNEAMIRFEQGQQARASERFDLALVAFECSFRNVPHPDTLYNIARAAEMSGNFGRALEAWRAYLLMNPEAEDRGDIEQRIAGLEAAQAQPQGTQQPPVQQQPYQDRAPQQFETPDDAQTVQLTPQGVQPGEQYQVVEHRPPSRWRTLAWYFMGGGVLAAGLGLYFAVPALSDSSIEPENRDSARMTGYILLGIGGAAMLSAVFMWIFADPGGERIVTRTAALVPNLAIDNDGHVSGATASMLMRF